jgi:hypothetical protein
MPSGPFTVPLTVPFCAKENKAGILNNKISVALKEKSD